MRIIWILIAAAIVVSCNESNDFVTESGIEVSCLIKGNGDSLMKDSIAVIYLRMMTDDDKVLMEAKEDQPLALSYDPEMKAGHIQEVLTNLEVGDSVSFETTAQNLYEETYRTAIPPNLQPDSKVKVSMKLAKQMSRAAYMTYSRELQTVAREKEAKMLEEKITADAKAIDAYLDSLGIAAQTSESGLRYVIIQEGTGPKPEMGDNVIVHYDGRLLSGEPFDSSRDRGEPFSVVIGEGRVIKGWDEGIPYIKEGGKATLYIPSPLAYGARSPSPSIPPYSILVFDVEVLKIDKK